MKRTICILVALFCCLFTAAGKGLGLTTVVIDAGHGGKDAGCVSKDQKTYEKNITLDIATTLAEKIEAELQKDNSPEYADYLRASLADLAACRAGYFAKDNNDTDEAVAVTHKENHWFRVEYKGQTGYCYGEYLSFTKGGYDDPNDTAGKNVMNGEATDPGDTAGKNVMNDEVAGGTSSTMNKLTTTAPLNVRAEPRNSGRRIGVLAKGTQVSPLDQSADGWVLIDYNGTQGWVYSGYLN